MQRIKSILQRTKPCFTDNEICLTENQSLFYREWNVFCREPNLFFIKNQTLFYNFIDLPKFSTRIPFDDITLLSSPSPFDNNLPFFFLFFLKFMTSFKGFFFVNKNFSYGKFSHLRRNSHKKVLIKTYILNIIRENLYENWNFFRLFIDLIRSEYLYMKRGIFILLGYVW